MDIPNIEYYQNYLDRAVNNPSILKRYSTVLPSKSDSDFLFYFQSYQGLRIDRSLVYKSYPRDRINTQVIHRFAFAEFECTS